MVFVTPKYIVEVIKVSVLFVAKLSRMGPVTPVSHGLPPWEPRSVPPIRSRPVSGRETDTFYWGRDLYIWANLLDSVIMHATMTIPVLHLKNFTSLNSFMQKVSIALISSSWPSCSRVARMASAVISLPRRNQAIFTSLEISELLLAASHCIRRLFNRVVGIEDAAAQLEAQTVAQTQFQHSKSFSCYDGLKKIVLMRINFHPSRNSILG